MSEILVVGANGTIGKALIPLLKAGGHTVRRATSGAVTGSGQVKLDLVEGSGISEAVRGVDAIFLLSPPGHTNQDLLLPPVIDAAREHGVSKLVLMTAMGADADESAPFRKVERYLEGSGLSYNIIRPNWFMQNFQSYWVQPILATGQILLPTGTAKGSFIDARDIAAVAAVLLTSDTHANRAFDLTGGEALDHAEVAAILTKESGRQISYTDITPEAMRGALLQAGLPADYTEFMLVILGFFKLGYSERITTAVQDITGTAPRRFAEYARDNRAVWAV